MGVTVYKATSKIGKRLLAQGRPLSCYARDSEDGDALFDEGRDPPKEPPVGALVEAFDEDGEVVEGVVRWLGMHGRDPSAGISVLGREGLVFVRPEDCVPRKKKGTIL